MSAATAAPTKPSVISATPPSKTFFITGTPPWSSPVRLLSNLNQNGSVGCDISVTVGIKLNHMAALQGVFGVAGIAFISFEIQMVDCSASCDPAIPRAAVLEG